MKSKKRYVTKVGLDKLKEELEHRKTVLRMKIADKLDEAKAQGDLSENIAYTSALEEYQMNENKIGELKKQLSKVKVAPDNSNDSRVDIGDSVVVKDLSNDKVINYKIVGEGEGDPLNNLISSDSKVGSAFVGKEKGDKVAIELLVGKKEYEIIDVS
jgi:transcription elongation factor GreA